MRSALFAIVASSLLSVVPFTLAGLPITVMASNPSPTTAPAPQTSVMLLPFHAVGQSGDNAWIAEAIEEDLSHDLSRNSAIRVVRPATTQPVNAADGLDAARETNAQRLVTGSYQIVDDQLRITGNVIDVGDNQSVGEIKATGRVRDLFQLEDALAMQLWHILPRPTQEASASDIQVTPLEDYVSSQQVPPPTVEQPQQPIAQPQVVYQGAADGNGYDDYPYADYGGYGYGYYGFGGYPLFIYGGYGNHGYHHGGNGHGGSISAGSAFVGHGGGPRVFTPSAEVHGGGNFVGHR